ncbi:MAG TPA: S46 family peptidase, partial [Candidatus Methylacidiphilales bacterium]|nr:S46 family peptidase [Candidatus Methylacidiphilales bacterium]
MTPTPRPGIVIRLMIRFLASVLLLFCAAISRADEGYWLFDDPPTQAIADKYHVTLDESWLDHLRGAAVKIGGASGSFVSADGLVITNRHVGEGQLHTLSTRTHNYEENGFYAPTFANELHCQGLEMMVLQSTENVTTRVKAALKPGASPDETEAQQRAVVAAIEKESFDRTGLTSNVVTLFGGARYDLYRYKKYPDVRLVFAPDWHMASFGGDPDNFEFPRFCLDICLFRVYDHGRPLESRDYLKWNSGGPAKDQLIFVAGHPGTSQRLATMDELTYQRDVRLPLALDELNRMERKLNAFSATSPEHARQAGEALASFANSRKAFRGFLSGLRNPDLFQAKANDEASLRALLAQHPDQQAAVDAFARVRDAVAADRANYKAYQAYERFAYRSDLFNLARTLVRAGAERAKPNGERLSAYRESELPGLEFRLFSGRPYYPDLEKLFLADGLENLVRQFGPDDLLVKKLLDGKTPEARAEELIGGTKLEDIAYRRKIYDGGEHAIATSTDALIQFARAIDSASRTARKIDDEDDVIKQRAYATIYQARVALGRAPKYPDATGTLRLAYGTVTGYEADGKFIEPFTDFAGMFAHAAAHDDKPPFDVAHTWIDAKSQLNLATPFN